MMAENFYYAIRILCYNYKRGYQGVAQLVARAVRDCEVVGSNPITLTKIEKTQSWLGFFVSSCF